MNNLDVLRAFAVIAVFLQHVQYTHQIPGLFFGSNGGWFGVQLFFLLSGYLIIQSAQKYPLKSYTVHRILRIVPSYLLFFLGLGVYSGIITWERVQQTPGDLWINLALLQHLFPESLHRFDVLHVSWTLTLEVIWYGLAPLLVWPLRRAPHAVLLSSLVISTGWVWLAEARYLDGLLIGSSQPADDLRFLFLNNAFPAQLCFFVMGAYIYFQREQLVKLNSLMLLTVFFVILSGWPILLGVTTNPNFLTGVALSALFILALQTPTWNSRVLKWLADISYSVYLIHLAVLSQAHYFWHWQGPGGGLAATALILVLASSNYYLLERPAMRFARRF